jgi:hypothetical protein
MMMVIFAAANGVSAWLGAETRATAVGMAVLKDLLDGRKADGQEPSWTALPARLVGHGLADILSRAYFTRMWGVQETAIMREVMLVCGYHSVGWLNKIDVVWPFMRRLKAAVLSPQWRATGVEEVRMDLLIDLLQMQLDTGPESAAWKQQRPKLDLLDMAYEAREKKATDPRDRFYAVHRLASGTTETEIVPDYSMSVEELYQRIEKQFLGDVSFSNHDAQDQAIIPPLNGQDDPGSRSLLDVPEDSIADDSVDLYVSEPASPQGVRPKMVEFDHLEPFLKHTKDSVDAGSLKELACLLEQMAQDLRSCAEMTG